MIFVLKLVFVQNPIPDDPRPTLESDLAGYYNLVEIELDDIDNCFAVVESLRANGWRCLESEDVSRKKFFVFMFLFLIFIYCF